MATNAITISETQIEIHREHSEAGKLSSLKKRIGQLLHYMFEGHEEFLGCTPD
jgi:hypothetical protein